MKEAQDYSFEVSLSIMTYDHKPNKDTEIPSMRFYKTTTDIGGFVNALADGHCYTTVFPFKTFGFKGQKNDKNFLYSNFLSIDFDERDIDMTTFNDAVDYKPTIAYTTCSNGQEGKGFRYRFIYCFEDRFESVKEYRSYVQAVLDANNIPTKDVDPMTFVPSMMFVGNGCGNIEVSVNNILYSKKDFLLQYNNILKYNITSNNIILNNNINPLNNIILNDTFSDKQFEEDFRKMEIKDIVTKYESIYPNIEHTPLPKTDADIPYILFPSDYIEIMRDCRKNEDDIAKKLKDGHGRRKRLFDNGILRRKINPNITFENLVYNLLYELHYYISNRNAENIIGKNEIMIIARDVMKADLSKYEYKAVRDKDWIVNDAYCEKYNLSPNQVKNIARKAINHLKIHELYDKELTDKKNVEMMKEKGFDVSIRTLKRWKDENGLTKHRNKK